MDRNGMIVDSLHPMNRGVLKYLGRGAKPHHPLLGAPDSVADAYMQQGSHPDIVHRVWDELGAALPTECRCLIFGTPSLLHDRSGIIVAICNGTQYNLRLTPGDFQKAIAKGAATRTRWSTGAEMDSISELGPDWVFGGWFEEEVTWCRDTYEEMTR
jgi:hypothetical protein